MKNSKLFLFSCILSLLGCFSVSALCPNENLAIQATTPSTDFIDNNDGTITHIKTGLMWKRCTEGQEWTPSGCDSEPTVHGWNAWENILNDVKEHHFAGYSDWRLPSKNELESIVERRCWNPSINTFIFPSTVHDNNALNLYHTSSSAVRGDGSVAEVWVIDFYSGGVFATSKWGNVPGVARLVRDAN